MTQLPTPHRDKLLAARANPKAAGDIHLLNEALEHYEQWITNTLSITTEGKRWINEGVKHLNEYKDYLEVDLIMRRGTDFLRLVRQMLGICLFQSNQSTLY